MYYFIKESRPNGYWCGKSKTTEVSDMELYLNLNPSWVRPGQHPSSQYYFNSFRFIKSALGRVVGKLTQVRTKWDASGYKVYKDNA